MKLMRLKKGSKHVPKWLRIMLPSVLIVAWLAIGSIGGPYFGKISEVASNDQSTFLPEGAESTKVNTQLDKFQDSDTIPAVLVFSNDGRQLTQQNISAISDATSDLSEFPQIKGNISPPIVSDDGEAALVAVNVLSKSELTEFVPEIKQSLGEANLEVTYQVAGPVGFLADISEAFSGIDGLLLGVALTVVFIILLIVYRSPILPFLVLLTAIFALSAAILLVYYLAKADIITLNGQVQGILFILVVGAATDYSLLFVARYKEELARHKQTYEALITSWKRSLEPILAAGGTVIAGLLCLLLSDLSSNKALGPVGSIGIIMAILSAITFLPAILLATGRRVFWPRVPQYSKTISKKSNSRGLWSRTANFVSQHARAVWVVTSLVLLVSTLGLFQLRADGVAQSDLILGESEARTGQEIISQHFPGGSGIPVQIIVPESKLNNAVRIIDRDAGVASVEAVAVNSPSGTLPLGEAKREFQESVQEFAMAPPDLGQGSTRANPFENVKIKVIDNEILLRATLTNSGDSEAAQNTVKQLRTELEKVDSQILVGGQTATQLDVQNSSKRDRAVVIPTVLVVITLILTVLLRSIFAPLLLLVTTLLSFGATLGIAALLFNYVWDFPGADPSVVLYGFIFLVALGIDYNIFLMTRVREESLKIGTRKGVLVGLVVTGGVITSAGIVLASTFAALAIIPILFLAQLAFIVAFGVLLDTIVVRSLLVPALVHDIGRYVWWPFHKRIK
jgi:putative drug exporter of the RND superfamily